QVKPLSEPQLVDICNLQQCCQEAEDALSQGMETLKQSVVGTLFLHSLDPCTSDKITDYVHGADVYCNVQACFTEDFHYQVRLLTTIASFDNSTNSEAPNSEFIVASTARPREHFVPQETFATLRIRHLQSMAPKSDNTEGIVLNYVNEQNRPLNSQNVADSLQKFNLKKAAIQKVLDALADGGKISFKEYGKQKIYLARQDQFDIPNNEELNKMKEENAKLQEQLTQQKKAVAEVEGESKALQTNLTMEEIQAKKAKLLNEVTQMEEKLIKLRQGVTLVSPEERQNVEKNYTDMINLWRRRKRMFKDVWDAITENFPKNLKELKEELGIEYDEDVGVSLQSFGDIKQSGNKRTRCK
ncbi:ous-pairing protein 2, partial [Dorcoceras hygrometricum]